MGLKSLFEFETLFQVPNKREAAKELKRRKTVIYNSLQGFNQVIKMVDALHSSLRQKSESIRASLEAVEKSYSFFEILIKNATLYKRTPQASKELRPRILPRVDADMSEVQSRSIL